MMMLLWMVAAATSDPSALLQRVQQTYQKGGDLSAEFTQTYYDKLRGKRPAESGKLWAKTDGRVRWSYQKPTQKDFVYDGDSAYFYEPESAQVTVFEKFQDSPLWSALQFFWGQGELGKAFRVGMCKKNCVAATDELEVLELTPKEPIAAVERALLIVDPSTHRVKKSIVFDSLGNRTEYTFANIKLGVSVSGAKFDFRIPKGVQILRAEGT